MSFSPRIPAIAAVLATVLAACPPALADNGTGGVAYGSTPPGETGTAELHAAPAALLGSRLSFAGTATPGASLLIQRFDPKAQTWVTTATAKADRNGDFVARWRTDHIGVFKMRSVPAEGRQVRASSLPPTVQVTVYERARATWFGPGFYGHRTACGQKMTRTLVGVANRTLPCGTKVSFLYQGRTIVVPVVDRGPYGAGASWDLTYAAAQALGFSFTDTLGAVALRGRSNS
jgi:rare lipoprotein A